MPNESSPSTRPSTALGRALIVYAGLSFGALEVTELLTERLGLPDWTFTAVLVALVLGFPVVAATAWFSATGAHRRRTESAASLPLHLRLFTWRNAALGGVGAFALIGVIQTVGWLTGAAFGPSEADWARDEGLALLEEAIDEDEDSVAYVLALRVEAALPDDAEALRLVDLAAPLDTLVSEPPGARVFRRSWLHPSNEWEDVGTTPYVARRAPWRYVYRAELDGYATSWRGASARGAVFPEIQLVGADDPRARMVRISQPRQRILIPGFDHLVPPAEIRGFYVSRYEVTNAEYKAFVAAGGYQDREFWREPFEEDGTPVAWADAVARFIDRTGRPGPSTWSAGDYPDGEDDHPVAGVSWYEAAAYAEFAGHSLPTVWHWNAAATPGVSDHIVLPANMVGKTQALPVGSSQSITGFGIFDMAGNVREWTYNEDSSFGRRYLLGGGYDDPAWAFNDAASFSAWDRGPTNGFRLASFEDPDHVGVTEARAPIPSPMRDFYAETPISDEVFEVYRRMYDYDPMPLNALIEQADTTEAYIGELVTLDAAYGGERLMAYVYRPPAVTGPLQTVIHFPGSQVIYQRESTIDYGWRNFDFLVKNGRAVVFPVYKGTLERGGNLNSDYPDETTRYREFVVQWVQDLNRAIDYVEERPDLDGDRLAYYGSSWGGYLGGIIPAVTPRLDAVVLRVAGLTFQRSLPEVEALNYLPRITIPVIMINGEHDFFFPVETSQKPMFDLLGTPPELKRHVVYPGSHSVPRDRLIQETLDFLDEHLGPVSR